MLLSNGFLTYLYASITHPVDSNASHPQGHELICYCSLIGWISLFAARVSYLICPKPIELLMRDLACRNLLNYERTFRLTCSPSRRTVIKIHHLECPLDKCQHPFSVDEVAFSNGFWFQIVLFRKNFCWLSFKFLNVQAAIFDFF